MHESHRWWTRGPVPGLLTLAGAVLFVVVGYIGEVVAWRPCTVAEPCVAEPIGFTSLGLLLATVVTAFIHRATARWLVIGFGASFALAGWLELPQIWWAKAAAAGLEMALCWTVLRPSPAESPSASARRRRLWRSGAVALALVALAASVAYVPLQRAGEARVAAAELVRTEVVDHDSLGVYVIIDSVVEQVAVIEPTDYPIGSIFSVRVDDRGLRQPESEEYEAGGWLFLAGLAGGVAVACYRRAANAAAQVPGHR